MANDSDSVDLISLLSQALSSSPSALPGAATELDLQRSRERLAQRLANELPANETATAPHTTLRASEADWRGGFPGCEMRQLRSDPHAAQHSMLVRMQPGAEIPAHTHPVEEETYVIEGSVTVGDERLQAGDFQVAAAGTSHALMRAEQGAILLISYRNPN